MLANIFSIIINTVTGFFAGVLLLRFWMQAVRVRPPQQLGAFVFQLSDWLVMPLRKVLPGVGGYDWSSLMGAFLISLVASLCDDFLRGYLFLPDTLLVLWHVVR
ncbi:MAG: putative rane protein, partial [Pseudomonadota bacterium]